MSKKPSVKQWISLSLLVLTWVLVPVLGLLGEGYSYVVSLVVIICGILALFFSFELSKPTAREIVILAVLCAIAVASRYAFTVVPFIKPFTAVVILTGICLGGQAGFVCGALAMLVSNFFFGQGPWTAWQMIAYGTLGLLSGLIFYRRKTNPFVVALVSMVLLVGLIGPLLDLSTFFYMMMDAPQTADIWAVLVMGFVPTLTRAASTAVCLVILTKPTTEILNRIRQKYGVWEAA